jgi:drug/metabolite transporter (DMT)-like permease
VVLISGAIGGTPYGAAPGFGVILGFGTALCYAGYLLVIRRGGRDARRPAGPVAVATLLVVITAGIAGTGYGDLDLLPAPASLAWLALLGITSQSAGYLFISISLPRLPAVVTSIILLSQPVMTVVFSILLLGERPSPAQFLGVGLVIGGIAAATVPIARIRDGFAAARAGRSVATNKGRLDL